MKAILVLAVMLGAMTGAAVAAQAEPHDVAVAIYFKDASGKTKPHLFYDQNTPFQMSMCKARLDYLTKFFFRMTRKNPDFKGKTAVKSACVKIKGFDYGD